MGLHIDEDGEVYFDYYTLHCSKCHNVLTSYEDNLDKRNQEASEKGWVIHSRGRSLCPVCALDQHTLQ